MSFITIFSPFVSFKLFIATPGAQVQLKNIIIFLFHAVLSTVALVSCQYNLPVEPLSFPPGHSEYHLVASLQGMTMFQIGK